jgi:hypothetical protein
LRYYPAFGGNEGDHKRVKVADVPVKIRTQHFPLQDKRYACSHRVQLYYSFNSFRLVRLAAIMTYGSVG